MWTLSGKGKNLRSQEAWYTGMVFVGGQVENLMSCCIGLSLLVFLRNNAPKNCPCGLVKISVCANHPAGKDKSGNQNRNLWPPPEGTAAPPPEEKNPLFKLILDVRNSQES